MTIAFTAALANYNDLRYSVIRNLEEPGGEPHLAVYVDSKGIATIGAGFKVDAWVSKILTGMNLGILPAPLTAAANTIAAATRGKTFATDAAAQTAIDNALRTATGNAALTFAYTDITQVRSTFDSIIKTFEAQVDTWFGAANGTIPQGRERLALLSLAYNNVLGSSSSLKAAILGDDRARAWYEIRYHSNGDQLPGLAKRRFYESALFGLYADFATPTRAEADNAFRMLTANRATIESYERQYGIWQDGAGTSGPNNMIPAATTDYAAILANLPNGQVPTIVQALTPARDALFAQLQSENPVGMAGLSAADYLPTDIYLDPGRIDATQAIDPNHRGVLDARYDVTGTERTANDILVGEGGDDFLIGGQGNDVLVGGAGFDTYYYRVGDGNDRIIDSDKKGRILVVGGDGKTLLDTSDFIQDSDNPTIWKNPDGSLTLTHNSPWKIVTPDGGEIVLGDDFTEGDYGIHLVPVAVANTTNTIAYTDTTPADDPVGVNENPSGSNTLYLGTGNDDRIILAGGAGNVLVGNGGIDSLDGGGGDDQIFAETQTTLVAAITAAATPTTAGSKAEYLSGNGGDDLLVGAARGSWLLGGGGRDSLVGGGTRDGLVADLTGYLTTRGSSLTSIPRSNLVTNYRVDGEFLGAFPDASKIGIVGSLPHGSYFGPFDLHAQSLLTAFELNDGFRQATLKLTDLLAMVFDTQLFAVTDLKKQDTNFLENLLRHQIGNAPGVTTADAMLDRFTADLSKIAGTPGFAASGNLTDALIAFAMQAYYSGPKAATADAELFTQVGGGLEFLRSDVAGSLGDIKGYARYFQAFIATLPQDVQAQINAHLQDMADWYLAGNYLNATAGSQAAFMLGAALSDNLTGGSQNDLLVGLGGNDILNGGKGDDLLLGGVGSDTYRYKVGDGNDTIDDPDATSARIVVTSVDGSINYDASLFIKDKNNPNLYQNADGQVTLTTNGNWVLHIGGGSLDLGSGCQDGDFGIHLKDAPVDPTNTIQGDRSTDKNDILPGENGGERIQGLSGQDRLWGLTDGYNYYGSDGDDILEGGADSDILAGQGGDDKLYGDSEIALAQAIANGRTDNPTGQRGDWLDGGSGDDLLITGAGNDILEGGPGKDILVGGAGDDVLDGDDDYLATGFDWSVTYGTGPFDPAVGPLTSYNLPGFPSDDDVLYGGGGNDCLMGLKGNDTLYGEEGNDILAGDDNDDTLFGGAGNDQMTGDYGRLAYASGSGIVIQGNDYLDGEAGDDWLQGEAGDDILYGGDGNDKLLGGTGNDDAVGGVGDDLVIGGDGSDRLGGNGGNDRVYAKDEITLANAIAGQDGTPTGQQGDWLDGGSGADTLVGGNGNDQIYAVYSVRHIDPAWPAEYPAGIQVPCAHGPSTSRNERPLAVPLPAAAILVERGTMEPTKPSPFNKVSRGGTPGNGAWRVAA